jgi:hypothetical protein
MSPLKQPCKALSGFTVTTLLADEAYNAAATAQHQGYRSQCGQAVDKRLPASTRPSGKQHLSAEEVRAECEQEGRDTRIDQFQQRQCRIQDK